MIGNSMLTALILSTHLRPKLNMYVHFCRERKCCREVQKEPHAWAWSVGGAKGCWSTLGGNWEYMFG